MSLNGIAQRFATSATRNHRFCGNAMFLSLTFLRQMDNADPRSGSASLTYWTRVYRCRRYSIDNAKSLGQIEQQLFDPYWIPGCAQHGLIFARVPQRQAERDRPPNQLAMEQCAWRQQSSHELVGAKLPPIHWAAARLHQMLFIWRHHGECRLTGLPQHRWAVEQGVAKFMGQRRAFQIIPPRNEEIGRASCRER